MKGMNGLLRLAAVPVSSGISAALFFMVPYMWGSGTFGEASLGGIFLLSAIAVIMGFIVGCPIVLLVDWKWSRYQYRYVIAAVFSALGGWLLLEGAFAKNAWNVIWTSTYFWSELAPRRILIFSAIGLLSGLIYTALVLLINGFVPEVKDEMGTRR
ncbi:hypothetical protein JR065_19630 [Xanthomonas sp. AmX2]|uniref:hypothetical protein n=1 Tax=Xanthomonas sp. TaxID=29446 RepID=UPI0019819828|nr:hypothetical protein [Xanthomonas sp.]MBN6152549.1 hypothetical protein [Xanthomonas sp.]